MNKYQQSSEQRRQKTMRSSGMLWTAGIALIALVLVIAGLSSSAPPGFFKTAALVVAILLLLMRQVSRRFRSKIPRAAQPDPKSTLKLN